MPAQGFDEGREYGAATEAVTLFELTPGYLSDARGTVRFHAAFRDV